ncbi:helix-turn-helix domain-containing protein [Actinokineospora soli]|uniref:Helix-turn-helix domain-containing protein n=1 Tax=Actinokineospora soli TaxID=1048753 RepID=A0ABW2TTQ3_9PSEU
MSDSLARQLGAQVRALREQRGWTQDQLAHAAAMTQPGVARFEAGGTVPTLQVIERLAEALDAELLVLLSPKVGDSEADRARHDAEDLGKLVRMTREDGGWSVDALARAAGMAAADVVAFEEGRTIPAKPVFERLFAAMGRG